MSVFCPLSILPEVSELRPISDNTVMLDHPIEILLFEDNPNDAELTIRALRKNHLSNSIVHVRDGVDGIDYLFGTGRFAGRNTAEQPRLILLDIKMPKVDGFEVLQKIKASDLTRKIPVAMLTSSKEDPDIAKCYTLGVNSYIVKPVDFDVFRKTVSELGFYWLLLNQSVS
jgi:two-component system, response regulator